MAKPQKVNTQDWYSSAGLEKSQNIQKRNTQTSPNVAEPPLTSLKRQVTVGNVKGQEKRQSTKDKSNRPVLHLKKPLTIKSTTSQAKTQQKAKTRAKINPTHKKAATRINPVAAQVTSNNKEKQPYNYNYNYNKTYARIRRTTPPTLAILTKSETP
jgi:hypothetical protein